LEAPDADKDERIGTQQAVESSANESERARPTTVARAFGWEAPGAASMRRTHFVPDSLPRSLLLVTW
jgi:hypothetical protein